MAIRLSSIRNILFFLGFTLLAIATMGYHPGTEDDGVYLTAVKSNLNSTLYPHDAEFFRLQLQATLFDKWVAGFIHLTHIPVAWTELLFQFVSILLMILGCWGIARILFEDERVQWAGVALTAAMLTLPVAGTALYLADQHLHPRNLATGLVLLAVARILAGRHWQAIQLLLLSFVLHPIMAAFGISFCFFLTMATLEPVHAWLRSLRDSLAAAVPLGWVFESPTPIWRRALETRTYCFLSNWTWYEWLGALAPLFLFWLLWRIALKRGATGLARFALAVFSYGVFQLAAAIFILNSPTLVRLAPMQPMRFLQIIYFFLTLVGGCLLGKFLLKTSAWRWAIFLLMINVGMFASQRALFAGTEHLELPGMQSANPWMQSFAWIRQNTPAGAYFAMDPDYLAAPGEDYHSFRALAERSQLADAVKDTAVVTQVPELGPDWERQVDATAGWQAFRLADFERLKREFRVDWALVSYPAPDGLNCQWHNASLSVCRIP
ncbi:MAG TPA: hypothetical protein VKB47_08410 [Terracidiphilus sp.]|nr:hypothetical protein [Terracidiphilus sp.]